MGAGEEGGGAADGSGIQKEVTSRPIKMDELDRTCMRSAVQSTLPSKEGPPRVSGEGWRRWNYLVTT